MLCFRGLQRSILRTSIPLILISLSAYAGAPFVTDDTDTADQGHFEINFISQITHIQGETGGSILGVETNYGVTKNLEVHVFAPLAFDKVANSNLNVGSGDIELGFKY